jgi:hypothetical protein
MRKIYIIYLIALTAIFSSCSKYGYVNLNYPQEPVAYLPENTKSIAVVNRSLTREEDKKTKIIEAVASAEIAGSDKIASDECLKGVFDGIQNLNGVDMVTPKSVRIYGTGTRVTPNVLDWKDVEKICDSTNADVLLVLETFDSNSDLMLNAAVENVGAILSGNVPKPTVPNQVQMNILCYWRLYDPRSKKIADQFKQTTYMSFNMHNKVPPLTALPEAAYAAGQEYIQRFLPTYYTVKRDMYKKGKGKSKNKFKAGYRRAEVANWKGAIEVWEPMAEQFGDKSAGRACLNIAVAHEVLGDTEEALKWAKRSYEDYNDKLGRSYAKTLLKRRSLESRF